MTNQEIKNITSESLRDWFKKEKWVRITTSGNIAGPCGTSKNKKNPDRCLPKAKAQSLSKAERAATARKKKAAGKKGKTVVANTKKAKVTREDILNLAVGMIYEMQNENTIMEKDDRCTRIAKQKYDTWPSAYASGAVVRCRRGEIWKKTNEGTEDSYYELQNIMDQLYELSDQVKQIMRSEYPEAFKRGEAYGAFDFGTSSNSYDTTFEKILDSIQGGDDLDEGKK